MIKINLQLFGGRGSGGGNNSNSKATTNNTKPEQSTKKEIKSKSIKPSRSELESGTKNMDVYVSSKGNLYIGNGMGGFNGAFVVITPTGKVLSGREPEKISNSLQSGKMEFVSKGIETVPVGNMVTIGYNTYKKTGSNTWEQVSGLSSSRKRLSDSEILRNAIR